VNTGVLACGSGFRLAFAAFRARRQPSPSLEDKMATAQKQPASPALATPGRLTRVMIETRAGEIEARLSEYGNWELKVRRHEDDTWKLACCGDLDCDALTKTPVVQTAEET
jgi:hypothetical protein